MPRVDPVLQYLRDRPTPLLSTDPTFHPSGAQPDRLVVSVSLQRFGRVAEFGVRRRPPYAPPPVVAQGRDRYQNVGLGLGNMERFTSLRAILAQGPDRLVFSVSFQFRSNFYAIWRNFGSYGGRHISAAGGRRGSRPVPKRRSGSWPSGQPDAGRKYGTLHEFACHPCAGAMLIFSVSFQF